LSELVQQKDKIKNFDELLKYKDNIYNHITNCFSAIAIFDIQGSSDNSNSMYVQYFLNNNFYINRMVEIEKKLEVINKNIAILSNLQDINKEIEQDNNNLYSFFSSKTKETLTNVLEDFKKSFLNLNSKNVKLISIKICSIKFFTFW